VLEDFPTLKAPTIEYVIVRGASDPGTVRLRVEGDVSLAGDIEARITDVLGVPARVEMLERGGLGRSAFKPLRVVDEP
jgi:hypothetical protein